MQPAAVAPCRVLSIAAQGIALQQKACAHCCLGEAQDLEDLCLAAVTLELEAVLL